MYPGRKVSCLPITFLESVNRVTLLLLTVAKLPIIS